MQVLQSWRVFWALVAAPGTGAGSAKVRANHVQRAAKSYQKLHSKGAEVPAETDLAIAADVLDLDESACPVASTASTPSDAKPSPKPQRRASLPAAAIPCAAGLRSRAAWKKALAAAQTARAAVEANAGEVTPRSKGSSERQESAQKTAHPLASRRDLRRDTAGAPVVAEPPRKEKGSVANKVVPSTPEQEAWIAEELQKLQHMQDEQERKLTHVLGKSQLVQCDGPDPAPETAPGFKRRSSAPEASLSLGLEKEPQAIKKGKDPKEGKQGADSPSRNLRAAAAFASDRAAPNLEPSLWDQLLMEAEGFKAPAAAVEVKAKRRSSPRRKGPGNF